MVNEDSMRNLTTFKKTTLTALFTALLKFHIALYVALNLFASKHIVKTRSTILTSTHFGHRRDFGSKPNVRWDSMLPYSPNIGKGSL